jgi:tetratricopeptide (TPR) repeat protein
MDRIAEAVALFEESLALKRKMGNQATIASALNNLGYLAIGQGNYERAAALLVESLRLSYESGSRRGILGAVGSFVSLACAQGEFRRAASLLGMMSSLCETIGAALPTDYEQNLAAARARLGEEEFEAAWRNGQAMSLEETIAATSPLAVAA